jgi:hypothetical protein
VRQEEKAERLRQEEQAERLQQFEWHKMQADQARAMQEGQFAWQRAKDEREKARQDSITAQLKLYGDIVKNVAPKFPSEHADIPIFFENIEKLFESVKVPFELRAKLLSHHLSERARSLLFRLDQNRQNDYVEVRAFLLNEFQLTPFQFKSRFDNTKRSGDETWTLYCTRLKNLLEYYCLSRNVENDFERFFSLLVADRVKSVLPQPCLNFILYAESADSKLAYLCDKIANMADTYHATHMYDGKPRVAGHESYGRFTGNKMESTGGIKGMGSGPSSPANTTFTETQPKTVFSKSPATGNNSNTHTNLRCFQCNQFGHKRKKLYKSSAGQFEIHVRWLLQPGYRLML